MARITYTKYENSFLATAVSFLSSMFVMGGCAALAIGVVDGDFGMIGFGIAVAAVCG